MEKLYRMTVIATGEVRDAEGNLVSNEPVETTKVVTESEALEIIKGLEKT